MASSEELAAVESLVQFYRDERYYFEELANLLKVVADDPHLRKHIHSIKWRTKDPDHLREKLKRRLLDLKGEGKEFDVTRENLFSTINDLAGLRILHLYTRQIEQINPRIKDWLDEKLYVIVEGPFARIWDTEYRDFYESLGIRTEESKTMYTSVHYVVRANSRTMRTCEIQIRTLAEEIWGEVDHSLNYPLPSPILACREQIKVLARVTSSCSRLVDSIFLTDIDGKNSDETNPPPVISAPA